MTPEQALKFIHSIARFGSKPGLRRVRMLLERMGNPQKRLRFIHVAGTNGKGSTCTMLSYILKEAGYRTGLYISPYVLDFRERIQFNNEMISREELAQCTAVVKKHWDVLNAAGEPPTEFEVVVAVAMEYFVRKKCELVVLEVGMGGRFDATNAIDTPLCSVITSIGLDHMEYLGNTVSQIAAEKCGIIKRGGIAVSYPEQHPEALEVIMECCARQENRLLLPNAGAVQVLESGIMGSRVVWDGEEYQIPLAGRHQILNFITAYEAVKAIGITGLEVQRDAIKSGVLAARFPARLEVLGQRPLVLLDGAHNASGAQALKEALGFLQGRKIHGVVGMLGDKEVENALAQVVPLLASVTATQPNNPRALAAGELARIAAGYCGDVHAVLEPCIAVEAALRRCGEDDVLLIFGSLYLASELRDYTLSLINI